jgi:hypothetical protein
MILAAGSIANVQRNSSQTEIIKKRAEQQLARPTVIQRAANTPSGRKSVVTAAPRQAASDGATRFSGPILTCKSDSYLVHPEAKNEKLSRRTKLHGGLTRK